MKVNLTAEMKKYITVAEMPAVKKVMQYEKENDEWTVQEWAKMAAELLFGHSGAKVLEASAEIAKNQRIYDTFGEGTGDIDVWIKFTAFDTFNNREFVIGGVYLSDMWNLTANNADEIKSHMYIERFKEVKN